MTIIQTSVSQPLASSRNSPLSLVLSFQPPETIAFENRRGQDDVGMTKRERSPAHSIQYCLVRLRCPTESGSSLAVMLSSAGGVGSTGVGTSANYGYSMGNAGSAVSGSVMGSVGTGSSLPLPLGANGALGLLSVNKKIPAVTNPWRSYTLCSGSRRV